MSILVYGVLRFLFAGGLKFGGELVEGVYFDYG